MGSTRFSTGLYTGGINTAIGGARVALIGLLGLGLNGKSFPGYYATLGIGAAATAVGVGMMFSGRPEITPGSSVQWAPGSAAPPAPASTKADKKQVLRVTPTGITVSFK